MNRHIRKNIRRLLIPALTLIIFLSGCSLLGSGVKALSGQDAGSAAAGEKPEDRAVLSIREDPLWSEEDSLVAMVISDLHYTEDVNPDHSIVPGIAEAERITDAIIAEVTDVHPDVLIMTGDHTNSGKAADVSGLASKLQKIRDHGIHIIMTTGNHDFDLMDAEGYEENYFPLLEPVDRDPASLSYTALIKDVVFLSMDDYNAKADWQGSFSPETMQWIADMLEKYSDHTIIFLSHHNVLYSFDEAHDETHLIQNKGLPDMLSAGGVRLAMTGHMHMQYLTSKDGMYELLSGMPFSGNHLIGNLAVGKGRILYYARPLNIAAYDSSLKEALDRLDQESADYMDQIFSEVLDRKGLDGARKERIMNLIDWFFYYYHSGTLADHTQEFKIDPMYQQMIDALWNVNYGPWMKAMIETTKYNAVKLDISW